MTKTQTGSKFNVTWLRY